MMSFTEFSQEVFPGRPLSVCFLEDYSKYCFGANIPFSVTDEELDAVVVNYYTTIIKEVF